MTKRRLFLATLLLGGVAFASILVVGSHGFDIEWDDAAAVGLVCGLLACGGAAWVRRRPIALLVFVLSLTATVLAGPMVGFLLVFSLATGFGALFALIGTWGEAGMEGVGFQSIMLFLIATITALGFTSQAWAILRAYDAWRCS
jgi:hypothetical protein